MVDSWVRRTRDGGVALDVDDWVCVLLADLARQLIELVRPEEPWADDVDPLARMVGIEADAPRSDDPAVVRLFPDAYLDDDEASADFRRFTERSMRDAKVARAQTVVAALDAVDRGVVRIPAADVPAWLGVLNDLRLTIGTRLGVTEGEHPDLEGLDEDDPMLQAFAVYDLLTMLQESVLQAATGIASEPPPGALDDD